MNATIRAEVIKMWNKPQIILAFVVSMIPIVLGQQFGLLMPCTGLSEEQFLDSKWHQSHPNASQQEFEKVCNYTQPVQQTIMISASFAVWFFGFLVMRTSKKNLPHESGQNK